MRRLATFLIVVSVVLTMERSSYAQEALALLHGVQSRRERLPNCTFDVYGKGTVSGYQNGKRARIRYSEGDALFTTSSSHSALLKGNEAYYYFDSSCTLHDPVKPGIGLLFDPRVFGLTMVYLPSIDLRLALRLDVHTNVRVTGREIVRGAACTIVTVDDRFGERLTYWISIEDDFRVYKCEHQTGSRRAIIESSFDDSVAQGVIPSRVAVQRFDEAGGLAAKLTFVIENYSEENASTPIELSELQMEPGTPVTDIRILQRIGYWNGREVQRDFPVAQPSNAPAPGLGRATWMWWLLACATGIAIIAAVIVYRRIT